LASNGRQGNAGSAYASISGDGRYVGFTSEASNLVSSDTNNAPDAFVHDRVKHTTTRVSVASDGTQGNAGSSNYGTPPRLSADGRYVVFDSMASNLAAEDTDFSLDVFVHDLVTHETRLVSIASDGIKENVHSGNSSISADGRFVAFSSGAANLVPADSNREADVFVHDRESGQTTRVSVASTGTEANSGSELPSLSADGRYVAFDSFASNLVAGDTNGQNDVFVHDRQTGKTTRVSVSSRRVQGNNQSSWPSISADGRIVAFLSEASTLVSGDTNARADYFVHDRETGETTCVSCASHTGSYGITQDPVGVSANGKLVAFSSDADDLVEGDTNGLADVFIHDDLKVVYLLLHGLNSDPTTWNDLVRSRFGNKCPAFGWQPSIPTATCYRYLFADSSVGDDIWDNGDGSTFEWLGTEVNWAVNKVNETVHPDAIVLVGHSRGGLAARAYLQEIDQQPAFQLGLLTIGTPHQGSPFGRIKRLMEANGYAPDDAVGGILRFIFSPSVGYLATAHDVNGVPIRTATSAAIWKLNDGASRLDDWVSVFGQIASIGLRLGEKAFGTDAVYVNMLDGDGHLVTPLIDNFGPTDYKRMRRFVLANIGYDSQRTLLGHNDNGTWQCTDQDTTINNWACYGDGIVPYVSQRLTILPGFARGKKPLYAANLRRIPHTDYFKINGETAQVGPIGAMLSKMRSWFR